MSVINSDIDRAQVAMWTAVAELLDENTRAAASALHGQPDPAMARAAATSIRDLLLKMEAVGLQSRRDSIKYARKQAKEHTEAQVKLMRREMAGL